MTSIITHEALYEILLKEKTRNELQSLEASFFHQLQSYIEEKELILASQKQKQSFPEEIKKTEKQLQSVKRLSLEITERRKRKILNLALLNSRTPQAINTSSLLPKEQELYQTTLDSLNKYDLPIETKIQPKTLKNKNSDLVSVKFLDSIPKFMGTDNQVYGPFKKDDTANLPTKLANILINKKRAEKIEDETPKNLE